MSASAETHPQNARQTQCQGKVEADELQPKEDLIQYVEEYARKNPGKAALWCVGIGFILGWKLKPW